MESLVIYENLHINQLILVCKKSPPWSGLPCTYLLKCNMCFLYFLFSSEPFVTKQTMLKPQCFKVSIVVSASLLTFYIVQKLFDIEMGRGLKLISKNYSCTKRMLSIQNYVIIWRHKAVLKTSYCLLRVNFDTSRHLWWEILDVL